MSDEIKIDAHHSDYDENVETWAHIDRVVRGKTRGAGNVRDYIPQLNPADKSSANAARNCRYRARAIFVRIAGRAVGGFVGMAFERDPTLHVPDELAYVKQNADGAGVSIYSQAQDLLGSVLSKGRAGLLVDYPITDSSASVADIRAGRVFATIHRFEPEAIINWGQIPNGAQVQLGRVVLRTATDDVYGNRTEAIRELLMVDGAYVSREYRKSEEGEWELYSTAHPRDGGGQPWREIPFIFVGSKTNSAHVNDAPMSDLCDINIGHLLNSADYENGVFMAGQPQPVFIGMEQSDAIDQATGEPVLIGSGRAFFLPQGGDFKFVSAVGNPLAKEAMDAKWQMAIGMGAMLLSPASAVKTATQASGEQTQQTSQLSLAAVNVSEAYTRAIGWMCQYMNIDAEGADYGFEISTDFFDHSLDANMLRELTAMVLQGTMPKSDYWAALKKAEKIDPAKSAEEIAEEIAADRVADVSMPDLEPDGGDDDEAEVATLERGVI